MKKIGNIVTSNKRVVYSDLFNKVTSAKDCIADLPTLYIGLNNAKDNIENFSIIEKYYNNKDIWWTFSKTEKRSDYEDDVKSFYNYAINKSLSKVKYKYIDLPKMKYNSVKKLIEYIKSDDIKLCFITRYKNFIFIYSEKYSTVFGLSLTYLEYIGVQRDKVIDKIKSNSCNKFISSKFLTNELYDIVKDNTHYILPLYTYFHN